MRSRKFGGTRSKKPKGSLFAEKQDEKRFVALRRPYENTFRLHLKEGGKSES